MFTSNAVIFRCVLQYVHSAGIIHRVSISRTSTVM